MKVVADFFNKMEMQRVLAKVFSLYLTFRFINAFTNRNKANVSLENTIE
jgi:hypothetical protein